VVVLNDEESAKFEVQDYFKSTILLRKFDEAAKKTDIKMKSIHDYKKLLTSKLI
jgi:predicted HD phosphohydrolase